MGSCSQGNLLRLSRVSLALPPSSSLLLLRGMLEGLFSARRSCSALCPAWSELGRAVSRGHAEAGSGRKGKLEGLPSGYSIVVCLTRIPRIASGWTHPYFNVSTRVHSRQEIELDFCVDGCVDNEEWVGLRSLTPRLWNCDYLSFARSPLVLPCLVFLAS